MQKRVEKFTILRREQVHEVLSAKSVIYYSVEKVPGRWIKGVTVGLTCISMFFLIVVYLLKGIGGYLPCPTNRAESVEVRNGVNMAMQKEKKDRSYGVYRVDHKIGKLLNRTACIAGCLYN